MIDEGELINLALESGMADAVLVGIFEIEFREDFRRACEANVCRRFNTSWMGPPAVGPIRILKERVRDYQSGLLVQTVHNRDGKFDLNGMMRAAVVHEELFRNLLKRIRLAYPAKELLPLSAGCCNFCAECSNPEGKPCRHPDQALSSLEAYGIDVLALKKKAGLVRQDAGATFYLVGLIFFNKR